MPRHYDKCPSWVTPRKRKRPLLYERDLYRVAVKVYEQIQYRHGNMMNGWLDRMQGLRYQMDQLTAKLHAAQRAMGRLQLHDLAGRISDKHFELTNDAVQRLENYCARVHERLESMPISLRHVFDDLCGLRRNFNGFDFTEYDIRVTTDEITLEDIYLGDFQIVLPYSSIGESYHRHQHYEVLALDPHPSAKRQNVTHPHVSGGQLCEGNGAEAIRKALGEGRLFDFFVLVNAVLHTYNEHGPYVKLEEWEGPDCDDCGEKIDDDCEECCRTCGGVYCRHCVQECHVCQGTICHDHQETCCDCGETFCWSTRSTRYQCGAYCSNCGDLFCKDCLTDGICRKCTDEVQEEEEKELDAETEETEV